MHQAIFCIRCERKLKEECFSTVCIDIARPSVSFKALFGQAWRLLPLLLPLLPCKEHLGLMGAFFVCFGGIRNRAKWCRLCHYGAHFLLLLIGGRCGAFRHEIRVPQTTWISKVYSHKCVKHSFSYLWSPVSETALSVVPVCATLNALLFLHYFGDFIIVILHGSKILQKTYKFFCTATTNCLLEWSMVAPCRCSATRQCIWTNR